MAETGLIWWVRQASPRLRYVLHVFCERWTVLPYRIITDAEEADIPTGWRTIAYGTTKPIQADIVLPNSGFIEWEGADFFLPPWNEGGFFPGEGDFGWDLPAMAFYVLTLYPLYDWSYGYDEWGLYAWHRAPFYEAPFWNEPFVLMRWYELLTRLGVRVQKPAFRWEIGWDIDHLYAWRGRGGLRWWLGGLRRGDLRQRLQVCQGKAPDPYDTIDLIRSHFSPEHSRFFFLLSQAHPRDSLVSPQHPDIRRVIQSLVQAGYSVGIHPSFWSREEPGRISEEKRLLEAYAGQPVFQSRQHYLRFWMPSTFQTLVDVGIKEDFSLAFPKRSGFLLGTTLPVPFYRVDKDEMLPLDLWGPVLMDRVLIDTHPSDTVEREVRRLLHIGRQVGGRLHFIWHNSTWAALPRKAFATEAIFDS